MCMKRASLFAAVAFLAANTAGAQIYVNGPLSTGPTTDSGVAAPAGSNWSEAQHPTGDTTQANTNAGYSCSNTTTIQFRCADDFIVPVGSSGWTLGFVDVFAYRTGAPASPSPIAAGTLRIWNQPPNAALTGLLCGDKTTNVLVSSTDTLLWRIFNTVAPPPGTAPGTTRKVWQNRLQVPAACSGASFFTPGTYWVDWNTTSGAQLAHFAPAATVVGSRGLAGWNARQDTTGAEGWIAAVDAGNPATAPDFPQDFPFQLSGSTPVTLIDMSVE